MEITNNILFNPNFLESWAKLMTLEHDADVTIRLKKSNNIIKEQSAAVFTTRDEFLKRFCELDEDGNIVNVDGNIKFKSVEDKKEFLKQMDILFADTFDIPLNEKIKISKQSKISVVFLETLENIVYVEE